MGSGVAMEAIKRFRRQIKQCRLGCWTWKTTTGKGFGRLKDDEGRTVKASDFAYNHYIGDIPAHQKVSQSCGDINCVSPDHLVLTNRSARELAVIRAHKIKAASKFYATGRMGEDNYEDPEVDNENQILRETAKKEKYSQRLNSEDVKYIRSQPYNESLVSLARKYRVCTGTISDVIIGKLLGDI